MGLLATILFAGFLVLSSQNSIKEAYRVKNPDSAVGIFQIEKPNNKKTYSPCAQPSTKGEGTREQASSQLVGKQRRQLERSKPRATSRRESWLSWCNVIK